MIPDRDIWRAANLLTREHGADAEMVAARADEMLETFSLTDAGNRRVSTYSGGMRRRVGIACGLVVPPKVVFLDLNLPKLSGIHVLHRIRSDARMKRLPIVILTSSNEDRDLADAYNGGANSYIVKPTDSAQYAESIKQLGLYWLMLNEPPR